MATEIERKFLTTSESWRQGEPVYYCQGYLNHDKHRTVRVRVAGGAAMITVKGLSTGMTRAEFEYDIPVPDARAMLELCELPLVEKNRWIVAAADGLTWEIDEFLGNNEGLVVAEVELDSEEQAVVLPGWTGEEVTNDPRYFNSSLSKKPFNSW